MRAAKILTLSIPIALAACADSADEPELVNTAASGGALIKMDMGSQVAVLLDDIPAGPLREAAAANALAQSTKFWTDRASRQVRDMYYRLVFRGQYYSGDWSSNPHEKGPLPLPDKSVWHVTLAGAPHRDTSPQHDMIVVDYAFNSYIVTDRDSPATVEANLAQIGGAWDEAFNLPTDPDLLFQRTGYACMDEVEYPLGSVFEENTWYFYDDACKAGGDSGCHLTQFPQESCVEALQKHTGIEKVALHFTRVPYDATIADAHRVGSVMKPVGADLSVVQEGLTDERRILYKYFKPGSCEVEEGVIGKLGWRRLMMFSAIVQNDGTQAVHIGDVYDPTNPWVQSHVFEYSACHGHYHFSHYGNFNYNGAPGSKRAFCLEDTNRFHNDESTPLTAVHQSCEYQGIGAGWGDEYEFGIPGQWVDITDVDATKSHDLTFDSNPDGFLCEGTPATDSNGNLIFDPTSFTDSSGNVVSKLRCNYVSNWHDNNIGSVAVSSPGGSYVTEGCRNGDVGPNRDCGFTAQTALHSCTAGQPVTLTCTSKKTAQVLRICEKAGSLGVGVACPLSSSISNTIVNGTAQVTFTCPYDRDTGLGGYSVYNASVVPSQGPGTISCNGW